MIVRANLDAHDPDLDLRMCRRCGLTFEALEEDGRRPTPCRGCIAELERSILPSDLGFAAALPLEPATWTIPRDDLLSDADWSGQNRKINALLSGRTT